MKQPSNIQQKTIQESERFRADGLGYEKAGDFTKAVECLKKALELNPGNYNAWINIGVVLIKSERFRAAEEAFRKVLKYIPDDAMALNNLGYVLLRSNPKEAESIFQRYLTLKPNDLQARYNYSIALQQNEKHNEALEALEQLLNNNIEHPIILNNAGLLAFNTRADTTTAVARITRAIELQQDLTMGWYNLAMIVAKSKLILSDVQKKQIGMPELDDDPITTSTRLLEHARDLGYPIE